MWDSMYYLIPVARKEFEWIIFSLSLRRKGNSNRLQDIERSTDICVVSPRKRHRIFRDLAGLGVRTHRS